MTKKHWLCIKLVSLSAIVVFSLWLLTYFFFQHLITTQPESAINSNVKKEALIFEPVVPGQAVSVASDMNEHTGFHYETWHYRANVKGSDGKDYGIQFLVYRVANSDENGVGWHNTQIYTAQLVVSTGGKSWSQQRIARGGVGQAGVFMDPFHLWIDNWTLQSRNNTALPNYLSAHTDDFSVDLKSEAYGPYVLPGDKGYSVLHNIPAKVSYKFSAPFLRTKGTLNLNGKSVMVQGLAWIDKEWGNDLLPENGFELNSFSIHLTDGRVLVLNQYHKQDQMKFVTGMLADRSGSVTKISNDEIRLYPLENATLLNGKTLALRWVIEIPKYNISLITQTIENELWLPFWIPSWEGPIKVTGSHIGVGFMRSTSE
ncbi:carotenoid 1,2-hydratase [Vibrio sp. S17_S38]|uniref:lipocalin-like domain-containing protein n=1 Tax=Vibrio sp. S17_S38 TaxID=2720229 RepID=UPI00168128AF|nr:lipocalin-like domain-containing protein [Vibrio sp. S17_S38]MBD1573850.1 carotenoid 1,2-hydratase [Vibrio sp. S17_S38]